MIQAVLDACTSFTQVTEYLLQVEPEMVEHPSAVRCQQRLILKTVEDIIQLPYQHAHVDVRAVSLLKLAEVRSHCPFSHTYVLFRRAKPLTPMLQRHV